MTSAASSAAASRFSSPKYRARYYGEEKRLAAAIDAAEVVVET